jgi:hypothetical protein
MKAIVVSGLLALSLQGCASIVSGSTLSLSLETKSATGDEVSGANCKMVNDKGTWFVVTPGSVSVHRSLADLSILCTKDGFQPANNATPSSTKGVAFGNILFGGVIGVGVDVASGAAYDYPTLIPILMTPLATETIFDK